MGSYWMDLTQVVNKMKESGEYNVFNSAIQHLLESWSEENIRQDQRRYDDLPLDVLIAKNITERYIYCLDWDMWDE